MILADLVAQSCAALGRTDDALTHIALAYEIDDTDPAIVAAWYEMTGIEPDGIPAEPPAEEASEQGPLSRFTSWTKGLVSR